MSKSLLTSAIASTLLASAAFAQTVPCGYEPNIGTPLGLGDDTIGSGLALGFNYTFPDGTVTGTIDVDSNGRILLPGGDTSDYTESVAEFLADPSSICPYWDDLNPGSANADDVYFNALSGKAVITWKDIVTFAGSVPFTFQVTLWADGRTWFVYDDRTLVQDCLVGMSAGNGAADPGPVDFSTRPFPTTAPTFYEVFTAFDLADSAMELINITSNYIVADITGCATATAFGAACGGGGPASFYEIFDGTATVNDLANSPGLTGNWTGSTYVITPGAAAYVTPSGTPLSMGDDTTLQITLPWSMPTQRGLITDIFVCSNGWVALEPTTSADYSESVSELLSDVTRICAYWDDLYLPAGGAVYAEQDPSNPGLFHVTWDQVPELGGATGANTFQLTFDAGGNWQLKFGAMTALDGLVGYSLGQGAADPGATDLTAIPGGAIVLGDDRPALTLSALSRPIIGQPVATQTNDIPASAIAGYHLYGLFATPSPGLDLTAAGAPGCFLHQTGDVGSLFSITGPTAQHTVNVPNVAALAGVHLYSQSVCVIPGLNALNVATTNGIDWLIGAQ